jgi:hypothetical protein
MKEQAPSVSKPYQKNTENRMSRRKFLGLTACTAASLVVKPSKSEQTQTEVTAEEMDQFLAEKGPEILPYSKGLESLLKTLRNNSEEHIPGFVHTRIQELFSDPALEDIQKWNREVFDKGLRAHYFAYILQDFRNSEVAGELAIFYKNLPDEQKQLFETKLRGIVGDHMTYEFLFRLGMRPTVFDPRDVPEYDTENKYPEWNNNELYYKVKDEAGNSIATGVEESPAEYTEGNYYYIYDKNDGKVASVNYYLNIQPNFKFFSTGADNDMVETDTFKTYLGGKGKFLWYGTRDKNNTTNEAEKIDLNDVQIELLRQFFRWER